MVILSHQHSVEFFQTIQLEFGELEVGLDLLQIIDGLAKEVVNSFSF